MDTISEDIDYLRNKIWILEREITKMKIILHKIELKNLDPANFKKNNVDQKKSNVHNTDDDDEYLPGREKFSDSSGDEDDDSAPRGKCKY